MSTAIPRMTNLFAQLGLDETEQGIKQFISQHKLASDVKLIDAPFWTDAQRQLLHEWLAMDAEWALVVDQLNEALHKES